MSGRAIDRRTKIRIGVAAILLVAFVVVPGYLSSRPAFLQRFAGMEASYRSWSGSAHANVPCRKCHVAPRPVAQAVYGARMLGEFYLSFVSEREPGLFARPADAACSSCHMDLRTVSPKGDLNIPHRAHVSVLKMKCVDCHGFVVHKTSPEGKHTPPMAGCLKCHDGRTAKNQCSACHTDKAEPVTHRATDWLAVHAEKAEGGDCTRCHKWKAAWCADCHVKRPKSHAADWRSTHRDRIEKRRNCEACHQGAFCVRCHGEVPKRNLDPELALVR